MRGANEGQPVADIDGRGVGGRGCAQRDGGLAVRQCRVGTGPLAGPFGLAAAVFVAGRRRSGAGRCAVGGAGVTRTRCRRTWVGGPAAFCSADPAVGGPPRSGPGGGGRAAPAGAGGSGDHGCGRAARCGGIREDHAGGDGVGRPATVAPLPRADLPRHARAGPAQQSGDHREGRRSDPVHHRRHHGLRRPGPGRRAPWPAARRAPPDPAHLGRRLDRRAARAHSDRWCRLPPADRHARAGSAADWRVPGEGRPDVHCAGPEGSHLRADYGTAGARRARLTESNRALAASAAHQQPVRAAADDHRCDSRGRWGRDLGTTPAGRTCKP